MPTPSWYHAVLRKNGETGSLFQKKVLVNLRSRNKMIMYIYDHDQPPYVQQCFLEEKRGDEKDKERTVQNFAD